MDLMIGIEDGVAELGGAGLACGESVTLRDGGCLTGVLAEGLDMVCLMVSCGVDLPTD